MQAAWDMLGNASGAVQYVQSCWWTDSNPPIACKICSSLIPLTMLICLFYVPRLGFAKLSILLLYRRLSPVCWFRATIHIAMGISRGHWIDLIFPLMLLNDLISINSDRTVKAPYVDEAERYIATTGVYITNDIFIWNFSLSMMSNSQVLRSQRIGLCAKFTHNSTQVPIMSIRRMGCWCLSEFALSTSLAHTNMSANSNMDVRNAAMVSLVWVDVYADWEPSAGPSHNAEHVSQRGRLLD